MIELKKLISFCYLFLAGVAGTFVWSRKNPEKKLILHILDLVAGGLSSAYLSPLISDIIGANRQFELSIAFIVGLAGYRLTDWIVEFVKRKITGKTE